MNTAGRHADPEMLVNDLTCWILDLNLDGFVCSPHARAAARASVLGALRSGATAEHALSAGKAVVNHHLEDPCN